jgi:levanase/fructan beta-fructosidase
MKTVIKKDFFRLLCCITGMVFVTGCKQSLFVKEGIYRVELYRQLSLIHQKGWMNDPNGMFYYNGYITFYQYYPDSNVYGDLCIGTCH